MTELGEFQAGDPLPGLPEVEPKRRRLPKGIEAGHRYAYRFGARMGMAYANADGSWSQRPNGWGMPVTCFDGQLRRVKFEHATAACKGCGTHTP